MTKCRGPRHGTSTKDSIRDGFRAVGDQLTHRLKTAAAVAAIPGGAAVAAEATEIALTHLPPSTAVEVLLTGLAIVVKLGVGGAGFVVADQVKQAYNRFDAAANAEPAKPKSCRTARPRNPGRKLG